jgi:hypothetical protein
MTRDHGAEGTSPAAARAAPLMIGIVLRWLRRELADVGWAAAEAGWPPGGAAALLVRLPVQRA